MNYGPEWEERKLRKFRVDTLGSLMTRFRNNTGHDNLYFDHLYVYS